MTICKIMNEWQILIHRLHLYIILTAQSSWVENTACYPCGFVHQSVCIMPVNIKIFGSFIFLRNEWDNWLIVLPFIVISTLKFKAACSVLLKYNSQCAVQQRTETDFKAWSFLWLYKNLPWTRKALGKHSDFDCIVIYANRRSALASVSYG